MSKSAHLYRLEKAANTALYARRAIRLMAGMVEGARGLDQRELGEEFYVVV